MSQHPRRRLTELATVERAAATLSPDDEQGALVRVCHRRTIPWSELWPAYREVN